MSDANGSGERSGGAEPVAPQHFSFDGRPVAFTPGQTVGAALWADGVRSWRSTRQAGKPRGIFCGIGVCFDCLVVIDASADERACVVPARPALDVRTQEGSGRADLAL